MDGMFLGFLAQRRMDLWKSLLLCRLGGFERFLRVWFGEGRDEMG